MNESGSQAQEKSEVKASSADSSSLAARSDAALQQAVVVSSSPSTAAALVVSAAMDANQQQAPQQSTSQTPQPAAQQPAHSASNAPVILSSAAGGTIVAPSTMATIAGFAPTQLSSLQPAHSSSVNILTAGPHQAQQFQAQGAISNMSIQQPQIQVIQPGGQLHPNSFQFSQFGSLISAQQPQFIMPNTNFIQNMPYGGYSVLQAPNSAMPLANANTKVPIVSKGISLTHTNQLLPTSVKPGTPLSIKPHMNLQQSFSTQAGQTVTLISNAMVGQNAVNFMPAQQNILPNTAKTIDQKGKTYVSCSFVFVRATC